MPDRIISLINNIELTIMSILSYAMLLSFPTLLAIPSSILVTLYWIKRVKKEQVDKDYEGSWVKWLKSYINK